MVSENAVKNSLPVMAIQGNSMLLPIQGAPHVRLLFRLNFCARSTVRNIPRTLLSAETTEQKVNTPIGEWRDVNLSTF